MWIRMDNPHVQPNNESLWLRGFEVYLNESDGNQSKIADFWLSGIEGHVTMNSDTIQILYDIHDRTIPDLEPGVYNISIVITWSDDIADANLNHQVFYSTLIVDPTPVSTLSFGAFPLIGFIIALTATFIWIRKRKLKPQGMESTTGKDNPGKSA